jgi:ABC-2 type transport system permease protein
VITLSIDVLVIVRKEFEEVIKNKYILTTMASFPLVFSIVIPLIYLLALPSNVSWGDVSVFKGAVIGSALMTPRQVLIAYIVQSNLPFYLMMPSVIPTLISSYSIVGEKKCGTLEPLLATPVTTRDILIGKTLAAAIPSVVITWISFLIYTLLVDYMTYGIFGYPIIPNLMWLFAVLVTAPLFAIMSVYLSIVVSSRMSDIRAAQQVSAVFVIPIMSVFILELFGYISLTMDIIVMLSAAIAIIDILLVTASVRVFKREEILTRWA